MENASKALIMAGGILISILIIGLVVFMFSNLGNVQSEAELAKEAMQIEKYNKRFEQYNRSMLYGSDIISVINLAEDYNNVQASEQLGYTPMTLIINITNNITIVEGSEKAKYEIKAKKHIILDDKKDSSDTVKNILKNIDDKIAKIEEDYIKVEPIDNIIRIKQTYDNEINAYTRLGRTTDADNKRKEYNDKMKDYGGKDKVEKDIKMYTQLKSTKTNFTSKYFTAKDVKYDDTGRMIAITFEEVEPNL